MLKAACVKSLEALLIIVIRHNNLSYKGTQKEHNPLPPSAVWLKDQLLICCWSFNDLCSQESQAAQRQILMEFLKEARRNKREV